MGIELGFGEETEVEVGKVEPVDVEDGDFELRQMAEAESSTVSKSLIPPDLPTASCATQIICVPADTSTIQVNCSASLVISGKAIPWGMIP